MPSDFTNQCVLITGGKRIGAAIATEPLSPRDGRRAVVQSIADGGGAGGRRGPVGGTARVCKPIYHERKRRRSWTGARPTLDGSMC